MITQISGQVCAAQCAMVSQLLVPELAIAVLCAWSPSGHLRCGYLSVAQNLTLSMHIHVCQQNYPEVSFAVMVW